MKTAYLCETCGLPFDDDGECRSHELEHDKRLTKICFVCGMKHEHIPIYPAKFGRMGYGSEMDGSDISFGVCDSCLHAWVQCFVMKDDILYSGSNYDESDLVNAYQGSD